MLWHVCNAVDHISNWVICEEDITQYCVRPVYNTYANTNRHCLHFVFPRRRGISVSEMRQTANISYLLPCRYYAVSPLVKTPKPLLEARKIHTAAILTSTQILINFSDASQAYGSVGGEGKKKIAQKCHACSICQNKILLQHSSDFYPNPPAGICQHFYDSENWNLTLDGSGRHRAGKTRNMVCQLLFLVSSLRP